MAFYKIEATLTQVTAILVVVALSSSSIVKSPNRLSDDGLFELLILHNNDMHARFEQTSQLSGTCTPADREAGKCYGGFPRVAHVVKEARQKAASGEGPPVLYLNAGDTYTGTAWFTLYKWKIAAEFVNALHPDAVSFGNNEIEKGSTELSPFINSLETSIVSSNVLLKNVQKENFQKSIILDVQGRKVGIVGYLKLDSSILDSAGDIEYIDEVLALREEVANLREQSVDIIIALGHSDANKDLEIAKEIDGVNIVIGGRKNFFNWNGETAEDQFTNMENPTITTQQSGKKVLVVPSYAYNKYLGRLTVIFDKNGDIVEYNIKPVLLDNSVPQDTESLFTINKYSKDIILSSQEQIGDTAVILDGQSCRIEECNMGNLITDAMMYYYAIRYEGDNWTDAPIAIIHGGAISASIAPLNRPAAITMGDLLLALPQESHLVIITMDGIILNQVLEHAVANYSLSNPTGQFLQYSGIRVDYDLDREPGARVIRALVRCSSCVSPWYYNIDDWRSYNIIIPSTLLSERYGYSMLSDLPKQDLTYDEVTCLAEYISMRSPVYPEVAGRIMLQNVDEDEEDGEKETEEETEEDTEVETKEETEEETKEETKEETEEETKEETKEETEEETEEQTKEETKEETEEETKEETEEETKEETKEETEEETKEETEEETKEETEEETKEETKEETEEDTEEEDEDDSATSIVSSVMVLVLSLLPHFLA